MEKSVNQPHTVFEKTSSFLAFWSFARKLSCIYNGSKQSRISFVVCSQSETNVQCACSAEEDVLVYKGEVFLNLPFPLPAWCNVLSEAPPGVARVGTVGLSSSEVQGAENNSGCNSRMPHNKSAIIPQVCHRSLKHSCDILHCEELQGGPVWCSGRCGL